MRMPPSFSAALLLPFLILCAHADAGSIRVEAAWSRELPPVSENGAAYVTLVNAGPETERLLAVRTPIAARAELHEHVTESGMMRMRAVDAVELAPGATVRMQPGGLHVMLMGLTAPLREGDRFALTLEFAHAPPIDVEVVVAPLGATGPQAGHAVTRQHGGHAPAQ